jgi:hypothetical protein
MTKDVRHVWTIHCGVEVTQVHSSVTDYGSDLCDLSHIHRLYEISTINPFMPVVPLLERSLRGSYLFSIAQYRRRI